MRVLMLAQFYRPTIGGEERHVQDLSVELVRHGHQVAVATLARPDLPSFEIDQGVRIHRIPSSSQRLGRLFTEPDRRHAPPFPDPGAALSLLRVIRQEQPDIIHAHNWLVYSYYPLKRWAKAPLVVTLHDYSLSCTMKRLMRAGEVCSGPGPVKCLTCSMRHYGRMKGLATGVAKASMSGLERSQVDLYLAVSQAVAAGSQLAKRGLPYRVISNFLPEHLYAEAETSADDGSLPELPEPGYLLFVGDVSLEKGVHVLLQAYSALRAAQPHTPPLVIIGRQCLDTPDLDQPGVIYLGSQPHWRVMEAFRGCRMSLAPSIWPEPFGLVALEAMAAGKPVIASHTGGLAEVVVDRETGCLTPPGDADALHRAMEALLTNPALCARLGRAGRQRAASYRASLVVRQVESCYENLLSPLSAAEPVYSQNTLDASHGK
jgi:glycosyltransferase involved in cell wall biosynthesis